MKKDPEAPTTKEEPGTRSKLLPPPPPPSESDFDLPQDIRDPSEQRQSIASLTKAVQDLQLGMASVVAALHAHTAGKTTSSASADTNRQYSQPPYHQPTPQLDYHHPQTQQHQPQGAYISIENIFFQ